MWVFTVCARTMNLHRTFNCILSTSLLKIQEDSKNRQKMSRYFFSTLFRWIIGLNAALLLSLLMVRDDYGKCTITFYTTIVEHDDGRKVKSSKWIGKILYRRFWSFFPPQFIVKFIYRDFLVSFFFLCAYSLLLLMLPMLGSLLKYLAAASSYLFAVYGHVFSIKMV